MIPPPPPRPSFGGPPGGAGPPRPLLLFPLGFTGAARLPCLGMAPPERFLGVEDGDGLLPPAAAARGFF